MNIATMTVPRARSFMGGDATEQEAQIFMGIISQFGKWADTDEIPKEALEDMLAQAKQEAEDRQETPDAEELARRLSQAFDTADPDQFAELVEHYASSSTYADGGVLTNDAGFVLRMHDGSEFQITIIKSK